MHAIAHNLSINDVRFSRFYSDDVRLAATYRGVKTWFDVHLELFLFEVRPQEVDEVGNPLTMGPMTVLKNMVKRFLARATSQTQPVTGPSAANSNGQGVDTKFNTIHEVPAG